MLRRVAAGAMLLLMLAGCAADRAGVLVRDGLEYGVTEGAFRGRWWSYYERGNSYQSGKFFAEAEADYRRALKGRSADTWRARTYGLHFVEYFPNRELGIVYFQQGRLEEAEQQLLAALEMVDTDRAHQYLDSVRRARIAAGSLKDGSEPRLAANTAPARIIAERELPVVVTASDDTGVSEVKINDKPEPQRGSKTEVKVSREVVLDEGAHSVKVAAKDLAGRETATTVEVTVDLTGPTIGIFTPIEPTVTPDNTIILEGASVDKNGVSRVSLDQRLLAESKGEPKLPFNTELPLASGENTFVVASRDVAGNETRTAIKVFQGDPNSAEARLWLRRQREPNGMRFASADGDATVRLLLSQDPAPAPDGEIRLKSPQEEKPYRHNRTLTVSGEVVAKDALKSIQINGQPVEQLSGAPKESFNRRIPIDQGAAGENGRIQVAVRAEDGAGRVIEKNVNVEVRPVSLETSESRMPVAVLAFSGAGIDPALAEGLRSGVEGALINQGRFRVLDRKNLQAVLTEQQLASSLSDPVQAIQLGRMVNAQVFLVADVFARDEKGVEIKANVISSETSDIVARLDAFSADRDDPAETGKCCESLAAQLGQLFPRLSGEVVAVRDGGQPELLMNWTREDGVREGAYLLVVNETPPWVDETTGEVLAPPEYVPLGRARVRQPGDTGTRATMVDKPQEGAQVEKGMPAVTM